MELVTAPPNHPTALEDLPQTSLKEVEEFINALKKGRTQTTDRNGKMLAKKQTSAIKKWAGSTLEEGILGTRTRHRRR
jgi:hypothetical protein